MNINKYKKLINKKVILALSILPILTAGSIIQGFTSSGNPGEKTGNGNALLVDFSINDKDVEGA
jgi:hypothetical protein